ncbi:hypothetical protein LguiA_005224 [Lonicera macranthoides]
MVTNGKCFVIASQAKLQVNTQSVVKVYTALPLTALSGLYKGRSLLTAITSLETALGIIRSLP